MLPGKATGEGTRAYRALHLDLPEGHWRAAGGLTLSTLGWGSDLGITGTDARAAYQAAALAGMRGGINVLDTASNYREQASERDLGAALAQYIQGGGAREHVLLSSKAGLLHGDHASPLGKEWFQAEYVLPRLVGPQDIVGNVHCMRPGYIRHELQRSRTNLGVETIDVHFLHDPETQLAAGVPKERFYQELEEAFLVLEQAADAGHIQVYGVASWDGLRVPPDHPAHLELVQVLHAAGQARMRAGGKAADHHFRAVELPVNLAMPEGIQEATQPWRGGLLPTLEICREQGWLTLAAAPTLHGRLDGRVPQPWKEAFGTQDDRYAALQFSRSVPGPTSALLGCDDPEHMAQNLTFAGEHGAAPDVARVMLGSGWGHD